MHLFHIYQLLAAICGFSVLPIPDAVRAALMTGLPFLLHIVLRDRDHADVVVLGNLIQ